MDEQKEAAKVCQQSYCDMYCRHREINLKHDTYIRFFIGYSFFNLPENSAYSEPENCVNYYSEEQKKLIESVYNIVCSLSGSSYKDIVYFKNTYLVILPESEEAKRNKCGETSCNDDKRSNSSEELFCKEDKWCDFPIVGLLAFSFEGNHNYKFIDSWCRVYKNWEDFEKNNMLPPCKYCFPEHGIYTSESEILFASKTNSTQRLLNYVDAGTSVVGAGAAITLGVASAPVAAGVAACAGVGAGLYRVGRSISHLVDRAKHSQSILPNNKEAALSWVNIGSIALSGIQLGATMNMSIISSKYGVNGIRMLNWSTLAVDAAAVGFTACNIIDGYRKGDEVKYGDLANLCLQISFLAGAFVSTRQLQNELITENINTGRKLTRSQRCDLQRQSREVIRLNSGPVTRYSAASRSIIFDVLMQHFPYINGVFLKSFGAEGIVRTYQEIYNMYEKFRQKRISKAALLFHCMQHISNLKTILTEDIELLKGQFEQFQFIQTERDVTETGILLHNFDLEIENLEEESYLETTFEQIPKPVPPEATQTENNVNNRNNLNNCEIVKDFEKLLNKTKRLFVESYEMFELDDEKSKLCLFKDFVCLVINDTKCQMQQLKITYSQMYVESIDVLEELTGAFWDSNEIFKKMFNESLNKALIHCSTFDVIAALRPGDREYVVLEKLESECVHFDTLKKIVLNIFSELVDCRKDLCISYMSCLEVLRKVLIYVIDKLEQFGHLFPSYVPILDQLLAKNACSEMAEDICSEMFSLPSFNENELNFDYQGKSSTVQLISEEYLLQIVANWSDDSSTTTTTKLLETVSMLMVIGKQNGVLRLTSDNVFTVFKHMILFIKTKVVSEIRKLISQVENSEDNQKLVIHVCNQIMESLGNDPLDLLLEFASYFVMNRSPSVSELQLWKEITNFAGIHSYKYYEDITNLSIALNKREIEIMFEIDIDENRVQVDRVDNYMFVTPSTNNNTFHLLIMCKEQDDSKGGIAICYKNS